MNTNQGGFIISYTANDLSDKSNDIITDQTTNLTRTLETIKNEISGSKKCTVFVPIGQSQECLGGFLKRAHFTLLELEIENRKLTKAKHIDSKGLESAHYSLSNIEGSLKMAFSDITLEAYYTGEQGILNNVDCGRHVIKRIANKVLGEQQSNLSTDFAKYDDIICKQYSTSYNDIHLSGYSDNSDTQEEDGFQMM